ncbi:MAG: ABC transporter ATP-binding protein [bacterium]|jgi:ABC-2 type transport system ATP-binding protein|nr:ABC transporter ATP-binding protein [bacterium]
MTIPFLSEAKAVIDVDQFSKIYDNTLAVDSLSFHVDQGQIVGLVGPNGAGKTTTLRTLAGILRPSQGTLKIGGHDIVHNPLEAKRLFALIPDEPNLFEALTVWEHLRFIASAYRLNGFEEAGEELLRLFDLQEKRNFLAKELSRGMRQKVAICCAYLYEPKVLLFDEPLTALDPRGIRTIKDSILAKAQEGTTIIISSHLLSLIEDLCTHILIMHKGQRRYFGSVETARSEFAQETKNTSLEEIFFHVTQS